MKKINIKISQLAFVALWMMLNMFSFKSNATHVIGGNMYYKCLGGSNYEITLEFRRDCFNGAVNAQFDDPLSIGIYDHNSQLQSHLGFNGQLLIPFSAEDTLNQVLTSECQVIGSDVCVHRTTYIDTISLPDNDIGYFLSYERCCRTGNLNNIVDPLQTGAAYWTYISPLALDECNSSARFNDWPSIYLCANEQLSFDHSASDADGDSLVYKVCNPSLGASFDFPKPQPSNPPPYGDVNFIAPYSLTDLMGGTPLTIDPVSGLMTAVPNLTGQYLIGVCIEEYRDGELIAITRRDFEYNVRICVDEIVADFESFPNPNCESLSTNFINNSTDGDYTWYFDWPSLTDVSSDVNPSHTYAQSGLYEVVLINQVGDCTDTMRMDIGVSTIGDPTADFDIDVTSCSSGFDVMLNDLTATSQNIIQWDWMVEYDGNTTEYTGSNPNFTLVGNDGAAVVDLLVTTESGCTDVISKTTILQTVSFELAADTLTICQGESIPLVGIADSNANYFWSPAHSLDLEDPSSPVASPIDDTTYLVTVSAGDCEYSEMITVIVEDPLDFKPEIDVSSSCDETVSITIPGFEGVDFDWLNSGTLGQILFTGDQFDVFPTEEGQYIYVRPSGSVCVSMDSIWVQKRSVELELNVSSGQQFCVGEQFELTILPVQANLTHTFNLTSSLNILSDDGAGTYEIEANGLGAQNINYTVTNEYGCSQSGVIDLTINDRIMQEIDEEIFVCADGLVTLNPNPNPNYSYIWSSSNLGLIADPTIASPQVIITEDTDFEVAVSLDGSQACEGVYTIRAILLDSISININDLSTFYCEFSEVSFEASTAHDDIDYSWLDSIGNLLSTETYLDLQSISSDEISLVATDAFGCQEVINFIPNIYNSSDLNLAITDTLVCTQSVLDLSATVSGQATVEWFENGELLSSGLSLSYQVDTTTQLLVKATSVDGCIEESLASINVFPAVDMNITPVEQRYCYGSEMTLIADPNFDIEVKWYNAADSLIGIGNTFTQTVFEDFTLMARTVDGHNCTYEEVIIVNVNDKIEFDLDVAQDEVFYCDGGSAVVAAEPNNGLSYVWTNAIGDTLSLVNRLEYLADGVEEIVVTATDVRGCSQTKLVKVMPYELAVEMTQDILLCEGQSTELGVINLDQFQDLSFSWSPLAEIDSDPFSSTIIVSPNESTTYQVVITNMDGCSWTETIDVDISSFDPAIEIYADTDEIVFGESVELSTNQSPFYTYSWSSGAELDDPTSDQPIANPTMPLTTYVVTITNEDGCVETASIELAVRFPSCDESDVFVPNMFTPNGDNMNDLFRPKSVFIDEMNMVVFDRWGEKVFETDNPSGAWDGTFRGKKLNPDVFGYYLTVKCINGFEYTKQGNVTLVK